MLLLAFSRQQLFYTINTHYSAIGDAIMYYTTWLGEGQVIVAALLLLLVFPYFRNWWYFTTALLCNIIPFLVQQWLKILFDAPRPRLLFYDRLWMHYSPDWPVLLHNSFPSGHSEGAFSFFCFLSLILPDRYKKIGFLFFLLALSVCYSRVYLAAHFFEDIYAGSILGALMTMIIYSILYKYKDRFFNKKDSVS
jgi:membrane-associated phospholipid phosphatase